MPRVGLSKKVRFEIFKRDQFRCRYCGKPVGLGVVLEVDHIVPVAEGGTNDPANLVTSCFDCNRGKSKRLLSDPGVIEADHKQRVKAFKEQREQIRALIEYSKDQENLVSELTRDVVRPILESLAEPEKDIPNDWKQSVKLFLEVLGFVEVQKASMIAADRFLFGNANDPFLYFCGICRKSMRTGKAVGEI